MNLDPLSIPYRAAERVLRFGWVLLFVVFSGTSELPVIGGVGPGAAGVVVFGALCLAFGWQTAVYRRFSYSVTGDTVDLDSGVFSRREREIPIHRIQNVDTTQNPIQRALGIVEVRIETAGGGGTEARLQYLGTESARRLREDLRRREREIEGDEDSGDEDGETPSEKRTEADRAPTELFAIQPRELALLGLTSIDLRLLSLATIALPVLAPSFASMMGSGGVPVGPAGTVVLAPLYAAAFILLSGLVSGAFRASNYYGFRLLRAGDDLRYERGLLQRSEGTIPTDKIQALAIEEHFLARLTGYATLAVETAGYAPGGSQGSGGGSAAAVPLAARERCLSLARSIEPVSVPAFSRPPKRARTRYAIRYGGVVCLLAALAWGLNRVLAVSFAWYATLALLVVVPVAAHLKWANRGYALAEGYVLTRNGFFTRTTTIVPDYRVQTVSATRTVFQRRRRLATLTVDTAGASGSRVARAVDIDAGVAADLRDTVADRLQNALVARRADRGRRSDRAGIAVEPTGRPDDGGRDDVAERADSYGSEATEITDLTEANGSSESERSEGDSGSDRTNHGDESNRKTNDTTDENANDPNRTGNDTAESHNGSSSGEDIE